MKVLSCRLPALCYAKAHDLIPLSHLPGSRPLDFSAYKSIDCAVLVLPHLMDTPSPPNSSNSSLTSYLSAWTSPSSRTSYIPSLAETQLPCRGCELGARQLDVLDTDFSPAGHIEPQTVVAKRLYTSINSWETRLLTLRREKGSPNLITTLDVATVTRGRGLVIKERNELVPYFALSYTWGDPRFDRLLKVNNEMYPITSNLFRALVRLSYSNGPVRVWIDAICINQHDPKEKSAHIRNIFSFFQDADTVVVWLGEHGPKTEATFRLADHFILKQSAQWNLCSACALFWFTGPLAKKMVHSHLGTTGDVGRQETGIPVRLLRCTMDDTTKIASHGQ